MPLLFSWPPCCHELQRSVKQVAAPSLPCSHFIVGKLGAVAVRDADVRPGGQRGEHRQLRPDAFIGGLIGCDVGERVLHWGESSSSGLSKVL